MDLTELLHKFVLLAHTFWRVCHDSDAPTFVIRRRPIRRRSWTWALSWQSQGSGTSWAT